MTHDWLLVETLGTEPAVVAAGQHTKNLVPISSFLRRDPNLMAIQTAIAETVDAGEGLSSITSKNDRVIRTEVVKMSDGRIHGVQVWVGLPDEEPPERPIPGPLIWDFATGVATDTEASLRNSGYDSDQEQTQGRALADDLPTSDITASESKVLSMAIKPEPGKAFCSVWDVADFRGETITVGFVARALSEGQEDGSERLICRAMNWPSVQEEPAVPHDYPAQRIINGLAQTGVYRMLVETENWKLLKWLDEPPPFFDTQTRQRGEALVHPGDAHHMARMTIEFAEGATAGVLRLRAKDGGWTPVHMTVHRVELEPETFAALVSMRLPTEEELAAAERDGVAAASGQPAPGGPPGDNTA